MIINADIPNTNQAEYKTLQIFSIRINCTLQPNEEENAAAKS